MGKATGKFPYWQGCHGGSFLAVSYRRGETTWPLTCWWIKTVSECIYTVRDKHGNCAMACCLQYFTALSSSWEAQIVICGWLVCFVVHSALAIAGSSSEHCLLGQFLQRSGLVKANSLFYFTILSLVYSASMAGKYACAMSPAWQTPVHNPWSPIYLWYVWVFFLLGCSCMNHLSSLYTSLDEHLHFV